LIENATIVAYQLCSDLSMQLIEMKVDRAVQTDASHRQMRFSALIADFYTTGEANHRK
jgi:hypothetical protein